MSTAAHRSERSGTDRSSSVVVVSAGFHRTHVTIAAREAGKRGLLGLAITGAYPTPRVKRLLRLLRLGRNRRLVRLLDRDQEIPYERLRPLPVPELLDEMATLLRRLPLLRRLQPRLSVASWRLYGRRAAAKLAGADGARVLHFRAGFGHASIDRARARGMLALCDHAAVHPALFAHFVENRGSWPEAGSVPLPTPPFLRAVAADINRADAVVANSQFVKETLVWSGFPAERIHVVYLGVDDAFLAAVPPEPRTPARGRLRLLFAGRFERLKGAEVLVEALRRLDEVDWELVVAGPVAPDVDAAFLDRERVTFLGPIRRRDLVSEMGAAPVFVFPSFAEGSARAVFEALACGCYVITTPNAGSIVEDGVHGAIVAPGDASGLAAAIVEADRDRERLAQIGNKNSALVAERFTQAHYGDALADLYRRLVGARG